MWVPRSMSQYLAGAIGLIRQGSAAAPFGAGTA